MMMFKQRINSFVYALIDVFTFDRGISRRIDAHKIKFPARWSRYYEADYEPETFAFFRQTLKTGMTVLDIGAHIGLFSVVTAKLVGKNGKVYGFEPTPFTRSVLEDVVRLNDCSEIVEIHAEAVSGRSGKATFHDTGNQLSNANSLVDLDRMKESIEVDVITVDEFVRERGIKPDCLKIDVEGAELDLLHGARETFTTMRPAARLGLHPPQIEQNGQNLSEIWQVLAEYRLNVVHKGERVDENWFVAQTDLFDVDLLPY